MMNKINTLTSTDTVVAVRRLALEHPDWLPVLEAAVAVADRVAASGGEFAGSWVVDELARRTGRAWVPNLRILVSFGLLEKSGPSVRGGRRAYYRLRDRDATVRAIEELGGVAPDEQRRRLRFIGAGTSTGAAHDTGRQAGELRYEHRSWR